MTQELPTGPLQSRGPGGLRGLLMRYITVGMVNTVLHLSLAAIFTYWIGIRPMISWWCGFLITVGVAYLLHRSYSFRSRRSHGRAIVPFLVLVLAAQACGSVVFAHLPALLRGWWPQASPILLHGTALFAGAAVVSALSFIVMHWIFVDDGRPADGRPAARQGPTAAGQKANERNYQSDDADHLFEYRANVGRLDTYQRQRAVIDRLIAGRSQLVDVGYRGVFEYDTTLVSHIDAIDLFLDGLPKNGSLPSNVTPIQGSVLDLTFMRPGVHDGVLMVMLLHHLTGKDVASSREIVATSLRECARLLRPGGCLIIIESTVPRWFYAFECLVYRPAAWLIDKLMAYPATLQYPVGVLRSLVPSSCRVEYVEIIPKGRWILQFGVPFPAWLTPVQPVAMIATRRDGL